MKEELEDADEDEDDDEDDGDEGDEAVDEEVETHDYRGHCISHPGCVGQRVLVAGDNYNLVISYLSTQPAQTRGRNRIEKKRSQ